MTEADRRQTNSTNTFQAPTKCNLTRENAHVRIIRNFSLYFIPFHSLAMSINVCTCHYQPPLGMLCTISISFYQWTNIFKTVHPFYFFIMYFNSGWFNIILSIYVRASIISVFFILRFNYSFWLWPFSGLINVLNLYFASDNNAVPSSYLSSNLPCPLIFIPLN